MRSRRVNIPMVFPTVTANAIVSLGSNELEYRYSADAWMNSWNCRVEFIFQAVDSVSAFSEAKHHVASPFDTSERRKIARHSCISIPRHTQRCGARRNCKELRRC